jgi:protease IV
MFQTLFYIFNSPNFLKIISMKSFLKTVLAVITGIILSSFLFFFFMLLMLGAMISSGNKPVVVSDNSVLVLKAGIPIPDRGNPNPTITFDLQSMKLSTVTGLNDILNNIKKAENDPKIKGIIIDNGLLPTGWATVEEIRNELISFRESGKFVISYTDYILTQQAYYLSTAADRIFINPEAAMELQGLSAEVMFYKKALEKLGVEIQVIRHGKFKGAVEPFLLEKLSDENRQQIASYTGSIWKHVSDNIASARGISVDEVNRIADLMLATEPEEAVKLNLIDGMLYRDLMIDSLKLLCGLTTDDKLKLVSMAQYTKVSDPVKKGYSRDKIAVIYASGSIVMGEGSDMNIGGNAYAEAIRTARKDTTIKAIVLRVNSPGGNAIASDLIWREADLANQAKPVVVSMGNYAASGGYYISAPATRIFADPTTITGSIGVFGLIPNAGKLLNDKLGISSEVVKTNTHSDAPSFSRPMTTYEEQIMQTNVERTYSTFISHVANGRNLTTGFVDSIGQGRVWSGTEAITNGLVDTIGGLNDAIATAALLAGLEKWSVKELPTLVDPYTKILNDLTGNVSIRKLRSELGVFSRYLDEINELTELSGIQARLPYYVTIR